MPRVGRHPLKVRDLADDFASREYSVTTITHIPVLEGYWAESLEVLKLFFKSLVSSTMLEYDLFVFDNNSCKEARDYLVQLQEDGVIQYLILSEYNLRKLGALDVLLSIAPGKYVAYADSDVYFLPDWLETSIDILKTFPEAGRVTAFPHTGGDITKIATEWVDIVSKDPTITVKIGPLVDEQAIAAHATGIGKTLEDYKRALGDRTDVMLCRDNVKALLAGADFQFTITRKALQTVLPLKISGVNSDIYYDPIYSPILEHKLAENGFWILASPEYLIHHMGNTVPDLGVELPWIEDEQILTQHHRKKQARSQPTWSIWQHRWVRRVLQKINTMIYKLLYER